MFFYCKFLKLTLNKQQAHEMLHFTANKGGTPFQRTLSQSLADEAPLKSASRTFISQQMLHQHADVKLAFLPWRLPFLLLILQRVMINLNKTRTNYKQRRQIPLWVDKFGIVFFQRLATCQDSETAWNFHVHSDSPTVGGGGGNALNIALVEWGH